MNGGKHLYADGPSCHGATLILPTCSCWRLMSSPCQAYSVIILHCGFSVAHHELHALTEHVQNHGRTGLACVRCIDRDDVVACLPAAGSEEFPWRAWRMLPSGGKSNNCMKAHLQLAALEGEGMVGEILHGPFFVAHHEAHALTHMHTIPNRHRPRRLVKAYKASYQEVLRAMVVNMFVPRSK